MSTGFPPRTFVWAKHGSWPWWPGQVVDPAGLADVDVKAKPGMSVVYFYNDNESFANVPHEKLRVYSLDTRDRYIVRKSHECYADVVEACRQLDEHAKKGHTAVLTLPPTTGRDLDKIASEKHDEKDLPREKRKKRKREKLSSREHPEEDDHESRRERERKRRRLEKKRKHKDNRSSGDRDRHDRKEKKRHRHESHDSRDGKSERRKALLLKVKRVKEEPGLTEESSRHGGHALPKTLPGDRKSDGHAGKDSFTVDDDVNQSVAPLSNATDPASDNSRSKTRQRSVQQVPDVKGDRVKIEPAEREVGDDHREVRKGGQNMSNSSRRPSEDEKEDEIKVLKERIRELEAQNAAQQALVGFARPERLQPLPIPRLHTPIGYSQFNGNDSMTKETNAEELRDFVERVKTSSNMFVIADNDEKEKVKDAQRARGNAEKVREKTQEAIEVLLQEYDAHKDIYQDLQTRLNREEEILASVAHKMNDSVRRFRDHSDIITAKKKYKLLEDATKRSEECERQVLRDLSAVAKLKVTVQQLKTEKPARALHHLVFEPKEDDTSWKAFPSEAVRQAAQTVITSWMKYFQDVSKGASVPASPSHEAKESPADDRKSNVSMVEKSRAQKMTREKLVKGVTAVLTKAASELSGDENRSGRPASIAAELDEIIWKHVNNNKEEYYNAALRMVKDLRKNRKNQRRLLSASLKAKKYALSFVEDPRSANLSPVNSK